MSTGLRTDRPEPKTYGEILRHARTASGKTMGELARYLGVAVADLSDVELGKRGPFGRMQTKSAAAFLCCDVATLEAARP